MWSTFVAVLILAVTMSSTMAADVVMPLKAEEYLVRYSYPFELLDEVLKRTIATHGPYREQPYTDPISVARSHQLAVTGELINVMVSDVGHEEFDQGMIPVPFPIDKGLLGYRVALISRGNEGKIGKVKTIDQFRSLMIGQGRDWGDVRIYEYNRVPITTADTYESLFLMLLHDRFDLFPRGVTEVALEFASYGPRYPELAIDQHLLIKYPYAQCFYVSKSAPHLAERLKDGLEQMARDGSFDALFDTYFSKTLADLNLGRRVVITLENPFLPAWVPFDRPELWYDPTRSK